MFVTSAALAIKYAVKKSWSSDKEPCPHVLLRHFLTERGFFGQDFLYRGFDIRRLPVVQATGTDRDSTSLAYEDQAVLLLMPEEYIKATPPIGERGLNIDWAVNSAFFNIVSALSIYRTQKMARADHSNLLYVPKESFIEALAAVVVPERQLS